MYHFDYVSKKEAQPFRTKLIHIIHEVQNEVREQFTFQFSFIGSSRRNMITVDSKTNKGFDFDVNIEVNDDEEEYTPKKLRNILRAAFDRVASSHGYSYCEDSTRVLTLRSKDSNYSCDFAIVHYSNNQQQYIRYNKKAGSYSWEFQKQSYKDLEKRSDILKRHGYWDEVRDIYLDKKNNNSNPDKRSRSLYAETINECYRRYTVQRANGMNVTRRY